MAGTKVPVAESVRASIAFLKASVPQTYGILGLVMIVNLAGWFMTANPVISMLVAIPFGVMASAALMRLAFIEEHRGDPAFRLGPLGLQWGMPEWRLLGALGLLALLLLIGVLFLVMLVFVFGAAAVLTAGAKSVQAVGAAPASPAATLTGSLLLLVGMLIAMFVAVRVCLYPAATVTTGKIQVFSTWPLTRGQFWHILGAMVLLNLPSLVLSMLAVYVPASLGLTAVFGVVLSAVNAFIELPLLNGLYAHLYKGLRQSVVVAAPIPTANAGPWGAA
ncbi:MAG: hypothetical protein ACYDD1_01050 [Caulobacteraceae bacterium]